MTPISRLTQWGYDNLYRVTTETWRQTSSPTSTVLRTFDYDFDAIGRLTEVADSDSLAPDFGFVYDARGQLQLESQQHGLLGQSILFDRNYDAVGNQTLLEANIGGAIASGAIVGGVFDFRNSFSYDRMDRLTRVTQTGRAGSHAVVSKQVDFTYDAASQLTDLKRHASGLQVHSRFGRDGAGRLTGITHGGTTIAAGQQWDGSATPPASLGSSELLAGYTFAYDQANRLTELRSWADGTQTGYGYDDRSQLVSAATTAIAGMTPPFGLPGGEGYDFDAGGNRKSGTGASQSATGTHNQLQSDGTYNYFYDGEGNLIRREGASDWSATLYEWDHRNRLVAVKEAPFYQAFPVYQTAYNLYVEYIYDAFDQRVGKRVEDTTDPPGIWGPEWKRYEAYVWADSQEVLRFTDSDGLGTTESFRLASRYLWSDQVDQLLAEEQFAGDTGPSVHATTAHTTPGETFWPLTDHLGSVRGLVDNNGIIRQHVTYDSFGNRLVEQHYDTAGAPVAASHAEAVDTLFGYTGRDWDTDTNLQYNRARWYDPSTGRWLSQDPIGFKAGDENLYRYVGNEVTGKTDPSGLAEPGAFSNYWYYMTGPDSWYRGIGRGARNVGGAVVNVLDVRSVPGDLANAWNQLPDDWEKAKRLWRDPGTYLDERREAISATCEDVSAAIGDKLSTPAGWGESFVMISGIVVVAKAFPAGSGGGSAGSNLVHMTEASGAIRGSGRLGLPSDLYAGPASNANLSG